MKQIFFRTLINSPEMRRQIRFVKALRMNQFRHTRNALDSQHAQILLISGISDF